MPGPLPRYRPSFPDEFLTEARRLVAARTAASHLRQRAHLALLLHERPSASNVEVAATEVVTTSAAGIYRSAPKLRRC